MSHIFISYNRKDKARLDTLLEWLKTHSFSDHEIWYDHQIEGGNNWREEIATALNESFVVVVIVSNNSVQSTYCTYEWAYAMGQGIPILPLVFEDVSIADIPTPLSAKQFTNCIETIPSSLKEQIWRLKSTPPQVAAINRIIFDTIYDTHRRYFILAWIEDGLTSFEHETAREIVGYFAEDASKAKETLETLMMEKAFAFTVKQHRLCWKIIDHLKDFSRLARNYDPSFDRGPLLDFDDEWLMAFEYFEGDGWWRKAIYHYFEYDLENDHSRLEVMAEIMRAFPYFHSFDADILIRNMHHNRNRKRANTTAAE